jgi:hypothetical protein
LLAQDTFWLHYAAAASPGDVIFAHWVPDHDNDKGKNKPQSQKDANRAHAKLRAPGERANAQLKTWKILQKLRCCPGRPGSLPRPSTYCRSAKHNQDGKGSLLPLPAGNVYPGILCRFQAYERNISWESMEYPGG